MASLIAKTSSVVQTSGSSRRTSCNRAMVVCSAQQSSSGRRAVLGGMSLLPAYILLSSKPAMALIPEEESEDQVNKAKANRKARLQEQRATTQKFMESEGLRDGKTLLAVTSAERVVVKLSQSGALLEAGDVQAASSILSEGPWLAEFTTTSRTLPGTASVLDTVTSGLNSLKDATGRGDLPASKKTFVSVVAALKDWTASAGIQGQLQGL